MSRCKERGGPLGQHPLRIRTGTVYCVVETQLDPPRAVQLAQLVNLVEGVAGSLQLRPTEPDAALGSDFQRALDISASPGLGSRCSTMS